MSMLEAFLEVSLEKEEARQADCKLASVLSRLPDETLVGLATGTIKLSHHDEAELATWLDKFQDTPLITQALALAKEQLQQDIARGQQDTAQRAVYRQQEEQNDAVRQQEDQLKQQKQMLDLQLVEMQAQVATQPPSEAAPTEVTPPPEKTAGVFSNIAKGFKNQHELQGGLSRIGAVGKVANVLHDVVEGFKRRHAINKASDVFENEVHGVLAGNKAHRFGMALRKHGLIPLATGAGIAEGAGGATLLHKYKEHKKEEEKKASIKFAYSTDGATIARGALDAVKKYRKIMSVANKGALIGAGVGAVGGAATAEKGEGVKGAIKGGLLGGAVGHVGTGIGSQMLKKAPTVAGGVATPGLAFTDAVKNYGQSVGIAAKRGYRGVMGQPKKKILSAEELAKQPGAAEAAEKANLNRVDENATKPSIPDKPTGGSVAAPAVAAPAQTAAPVVATAPPAAVAPVDLSLANPHTPQPAQISGSVVPPPVQPSVGSYHAGSNQTLVPPPPAPPGAKPSQRKPVNLTAAFPQQAAPIAPG